MVQFALRLSFHERNKSAGSGTNVRLFCYSEIKKRKRASWPAFSLSEGYSRPFGGNLSSILSTALSSFCSFFSGLSDRVSLATPRHSKRFV